jgi:hypothetical protein
MMRGASGDECGKLLGQEYNRPAEAGVLKKPRGSDFNFNLTYPYMYATCFSLYLGHLQAYQYKSRKKKDTVRN